MRLLCRMSYRQESASRLPAFAKRKKFARWRDVVHTILGSPSFATDKTTSECNDHWAVLSVPSCFSSVKQPVMFTRYTWIARSPGARVVVGSFVVRLS